jgi:hypothetical protein
MTPDQIKQLVVQTMNSQMSAYSTAKVPYHIHNGVDAPYAYQSTFTYIGFIGLDAGIGILPTGWSVTKLGTGDYQVVHNLNTFAYAVVASPAGLQSYVDITPSGNLVEFTWTADTDFYFNLTVIANRNIVPATYQPTPWISTGKFP